MPVMVSTHPATHSSGQRVIRSIAFFAAFFSIFFLMIRRPPRSTQSRSSAASDVYKRQEHHQHEHGPDDPPGEPHVHAPVSYTHLRAHETRHDLVCRLLLEKKKEQSK